MQRRNHLRCAALQSGETLVGLMVGLVLSMVVVLTTLATFKISVLTTANAAQDAAEDAQITYSLMRSSMAALDIGYGLKSLPSPVTPDVPNHVRVLGGAELSGGVLTVRIPNITFTTSGNAIVWVRARAGTTSCAGLLYKTADDGTGGLYSLASTSPCSSVSNPVLTNWSSVLFADRATNTGSLSFSLSTSASNSCNPFGLIGGNRSSRVQMAGNVLLTISATNRSGATLSEQTCLVNIP